MGGALDRRLRTYLVAASGCVAAAIFHLLSAPSTAYAHVLVLPLLVCGIFGTLAIAVAQVLRDYNAAQRRYAVRRAAFSALRQPLIVNAALVALTGFAIFCCAEAIEQFLSLGHLHDSLGLQNIQGLSQFAVVAIFVTALVRALVDCIARAAAIVAEILAVILAPSGPRVFNVNRRPLVAAGTLRLSARATGRRGPPALRTR